jgi:hypothetical protein
MSYVRSQQFIEFIALQAGTGCTSSVEVGSNAEDTPFRENSGRCIFHGNNKYSSCSDASAPDARRFCCCGTGVECPLPIRNCKTQSGAVCSECNAGFVLTSEKNLCCMLFHTKKIHS